MVADLNHQCRTWNTLTRKSLIFCYADTDYIHTPSRIQSGMCISKKWALNCFQTIEQISTEILFSVRVSRTIKLWDLNPNQHFRGKYLISKRWPEQGRLAKNEKASKVKKNPKQVSNPVKHHPAKAVILVLILGGQPITITLFTHV